MDLALPILFEQASFTSLSPAATKAFEVPDTQDLEHVIRSL
jgi:hypothetical protein